MVIIIVTGTCASLSVFLLTTSSRLSNHFLLYTAIDLLLLLLVVSFSRYSYISVENSEYFILHLYLTLMSVVPSRNFVRYLVYGPDKLLNQRSRERCIRQTSNLSSALYDFDLWPLTSWPQSWSFHALIRGLIVPISIKIGSIVFNISCSQVW